MVGDNSPAWLCMSVWIVFSLSRISTCLVVYISNRSYFQATIKSKMEHICNCAIILHILHTHILLIAKLYSFRLKYYFGVTEPTQSQRNGRKSECWYDTYSISRPEVIDYIVCVWHLSYVKIFTANSSPLQYGSYDTVYVLFPQFCKDFVLTCLWVLTHRDRVTHICVGESTIIGSDNSLPPGRRQAIIWTNDGMLLSGPLGTNFSDISIGIDTFVFKKLLMKMSSGKWRQFCLGLNVLTWHICTSTPVCG